MASTKELQKTLPRHAPNSEQHLQDLNRKFAVYTLVNFDAAQLQELEHTLNIASMAHEAEDDEATSYAKLADQPSFSGRTLRDVYDHHIHVRDDCDWMDPLYFIIADQDDYKAKGLLAVYLSTYGDEEDNRIGVGRCGYDWASDWGVNFSIGNMDWSDLKETEHDEFGGSDPYEDEDDEKGAGGE